MRRRDEKARVHILVYQSDWDDLGVIFGGKLPRSEAIREILRSYIDNIRAKVAEQATPMRLNENDITSLTAGLPSGSDKPRHNQ